MLTGESRPVTKQVHDEVRCRLRHLVSWWFLFNSYSFVFVFVCVFFFQKIPIALIDFLIRSALPQLTLVDSCSSMSLHVRRTRPCPRSFGSSRKRRPRSERKSCAPSDVPDPVSRNLIFRRSFIVSRVHSFLSFSLLLSQPFRYG